MDLPPLPLVAVFVAVLLAAVPTSAAEPIYVYSSVGDNQWVSDWQPIDSPATVDALFAWVHDTWGATRMYWRGEQDRLWLDNAVFRAENPLYYEWWTNWIGHLSKQVDTDGLAVKAARQRGMEIHMFTSLFDYGAQGDVGGCGMFPYATQDKLLVQHPEWRPVDRWGERYAPGPQEFCYPEVRKILVDRHVRYAAKYDGISFYTYVENMGQRYMDEYGFNAPIVAEFKQRYGVDIRREPFGKAAWNKLRGEYVTQFLAELHDALKTKGKKLSVVIRPDQPNRPQRWLCIQDPTLPTGGIFMDWETWVKRGLVDELFIWCGGPNSALTRQMMDACQGTKVKVVVLSSSPFHESWKPFKEGGVVTCTVAAPGYGIDPWAKETTGAETLRSPSWRLRAQTLVEVAAGKVNVEAAAVVALLQDPHVIVRREAIRTLAALKATDQVAAIEGMLADPETSVRTAAATALGVINGPDGAAKIMAQMERDEGFQYVEAAIKTLIAMKDAATAALQAHAGSKQWWVRAAVVRVLTSSGEAAAARAIIERGLKDSDYRVRYWSVWGMRRFADAEARTALLGALRDKTPTVQLRAAFVLAEGAPKLPAPFGDQVFTALSALFRAYGDGCKRTDADWGWRPVGMALLQFGERGKTQLEEWRHQRADTRLAWNAYLVLHVPQDPNGPIICTEEEAVAAHAKYAPPFPGR